MAVRTWVGRFCVADGRVEEDGPWLGSLIRQRPDDDPDELYVLVEPASPNSEEYTSQLVDVIAQLYQRDPLSLTGALTRSLRAAHEHLRDWNRKSLPEHRVGAGAGCISLRGAEAYIAQVGPSVAYVRTANGDVRRLQPADIGFETTLGVAEDLDPLLTRVALAPGDLVLIASSSLEDVVPQDHIERILSRLADDVLPEFYMLCRTTPNFSLVLVSCFEEEKETPPEFLTRDGVPITPDDASPVATALDLPVADAVSADRVEAGVGAAPDLAEASVAAGSLGDFPLLPQRPIQEQVREITESTAPPPPAGVRLRGEGAKPSYKRTTGPLPVPQFQIPKLAVFAGLALAIVGLLAYLYLPGSLEESREDKFAALVATAREANARAQATSDPGLKRQLLTDARTDLDAAAKIHDDDPAVLMLQNDVTSAMNVLNAVYEIRDFTAVADLAQVVTGELEVTAAAIGGDHAYLLDAEGGRVLRVPLDGSSAPETILENGEFAGFIAADRPSEIVWSDQTEALFIVDNNRQAFAYFPDRGTLPLTVRGIETIGSADAITTSGGNLYVLDIQNNQVWRYLPGQGGFDSERTALLDQASLTDATEIAVGSELLVLDDTLGIRRFAGRVESSFPLAGIDTPLVSPASLSVLPGSNRVVVADRGNKRVVVASPEGAFLRQIVSPSFTDLRAVSVDEGNSIIYVLNGDTLLRAAFPP